VTAATARWHAVSERGTVLGVWILATLGTLLGRGVTRIVVRVVALWYALFDRPVRRASGDYLRRVRGRASLIDVYRHVQAFAQVTLDRLFILRGETRRFEIVTQGEQHLHDLRTEGRGALLVLAHLGSFEIMRTLSDERALPLNVLGYFKNAPRINAALRGLNARVEARFIEIRHGDPSFALEVAERIAAGELVGTMGDRVGFDGKAMRVPFLGADAAFPTGPYLLASVLKCPVYLAFGLYREPNRYDLHCELFAERVVLPRGGRDDALRALVTRYAARVEHHCRLAPENWFNFYDFWSAT
jgi:predicted LPLAT superfamily acyltransferase